MAVGGYHECFVAAKQAESDARAVAWTQEGLAADELVVRIEPAGQHHEFLELCEGYGVHARSASQKGQLLSWTPQQAYLIEGQFDPERRMVRDALWLERSVAAGYPAVRVAGEARWPSVFASSSTDLFAHEASVETLSRRYPLRVLCLFDRSQFDAAAPRWLEAHPRAVSDALVCIRVEFGRVVITGEVDISNVELLAGVLRSPGLPADVTIDMSGATFVDARGVTELVEFARRRLPGGRVVVFNPPRSLQQYATVLGLSELDLRITTRAP